MFASNAVDMATSNHKENQFFAIFHLFAAISQVTFGSNLAVL